MEINTRIYRNIDFDEPSRKNRIGFGGCAEVFKLQEKMTGKTYAIKILFEDNQSQNFNDLFLSEIKIISQIEYPTLLGLQGITIDDPLYIIMEYMPNNTVHYYIDKAYKGDKDENWNLTHKMIIILGISFGMEYLHSMNIVHRDLKPLNVLLDSNFYPRIGDFGFSKIASNSKKLSSNIGTPIFSAPEQFGAPNYDGKKADVFSFGMTIYSILYDKLPFEAEEVVFRLYERMKKGERPNLDEKVISKSMNELISRCWNSAPEMRPNFKEISEELLNEVRELIKKETINEEEISYFVNEFCKRKENNQTINNSINNKNTINQLLEEFEYEFIDQENPKQFSPLHYAVKKNAKKIGEILISKGADVNAKDIIY